MKLKQRRIPAAAAGLAAVLLVAAAGAGTARIGGARSSRAAAHNHASALDLTRKQVRRLARPLARAREVCNGPRCRKGRRLRPDHHTDDSRHGTSFPQSQHHRLRRHEAAHSSSTCAMVMTGNSLRTSGYSLRSPNGVPSPVQHMEASRPRVTTKTARSSSRSRSRTARTRVRRAEHRSPSGTPSLSPCTCGRGTRTQTGCSMGRIGGSVPITTGKSN
jgi:hypothetical protein